MIRSLPFIAMKRRLSRWTMQTSNFPGGYIIGIGYGNGYWVGVGQNSNLIYATQADVTTWTVGNSGLAVAWITSPAWNPLGGWWVTGGFNGGRSYTADPTAAWTATSGGIAHQGYAFSSISGIGVETGNVAGGNSGIATASFLDPTTWVQQANPWVATEWTLDAVHNGVNLWVAVGGWGGGATSSKICTAADPTGVWTQRVHPFPNETNITCVDYNGTNLYVCATSTGLLATSPDGIIWTERVSSFGTTAIYDVAYGNGVWVVVGINGKLATSTDGITWTQRDSNFEGTDIYAIAYDGTTNWVIVGNATKLATTTSPI